MDNIITICHRAETLLAGIYQAPIRLEILEQFESSHTVLRCAVQTEGAPAQTPVQMPGTVIVKQRTFNQPRAPHEFDQALLFRNEWASLDFLTSLSSEAVVGPRLYASDRQVGLVVLEDLGMGQNVQDVLYSTNRQAGIDALVGMGKTLGQIQRITHGHEAEFNGLQTNLEAATTTCDASIDCRKYLGDLRACMSGLDIDIDGGFDGAIHNMESVIHGPGVFRTFVHNDAGPHNFVATASGVQLLDFEFAGYGHGLVDIVCARLAFPPSFRGRVLPLEVVRQMEEGYRAELTKQTPEMIDDRRFKEAMAQACAHWAFSKLIGFWDPYLRERLLEGEARDTRDGKIPERSAFFRRQVFTYLRLALADLEEFNQLLELRLALSQIIERLLRLWPETPLLSSYPAFGGEAWHYP